VVKHWLIELVAACRALAALVDAIHAVRWPALCGLAEPFPQSRADAREHLQTPARGGGMSKRPGGQLEQSARRAARRSRAGRAGANGGTITKTTVDHGQPCYHLEFRLIATSGYRVQSVLILFDKGIVKADK
jgi:hypothetical protein